MYVALHKCGFNRGQACTDVALIGVRHICGFNQGLACMWL